MNPEQIILEEQYKHKSCTTDSNQSINNGGTTSYYQLDPNWKEVQDIIEAYDYNYSQGNILKVAMTLNSNRHSGTDSIRDLNKAKWFIDREIQRLKNKDNK